LILENEEARNSKIVKMKSETDWEWQNHVVALLWEEKYLRTN